MHRVDMCKRVTLLLHFIITLYYYTLLLDFIITLYYYTLPLVIDMTDELKQCMLAYTLLCCAYPKVLPLT